MSARENILTRIRTALAVGRDSASDRIARTDYYIQQHAQGPRPKADWELTSRFVERATRLTSTVGHVESAAKIPQTIANYLSAHQLPATAVCWPEFAALDWKAAGIQMEARPASGNDLVGLTGAFCAIAETGTLMLTSSARTPAVTSVLPETHIAVIPAARIVAAMEDAWCLLRRELGQMPRAVNFISGPSRTADIEQTVTLGAHGPYRVHVILVNS